MIQIVYPETNEQLESVRDLFRGFVVWSRTRYEAHLVDLYFEPHAFEAELQGLPGELARPDGNLPLATYKGHPAGCVGTRKFDEETCEMKRMFVSTDFRGRGIGRALAERLIADVRITGYKRMRLDTGTKPIEAQSLYRKLGFQETPPPYEIPEAFQGMVLFMALKLM